MIPRTLTVVAAVLLSLLTPVSAAAEEAVPWIRDVGEIPLTATTTAGGATARMPDGSTRMWLVVSGRPAYLAEIDPFERRLVRAYPLGTRAQGGWGVDVARDGTVYAATYGAGELYRLPWGADQAESLGAPTEDTSFLWQVDTTPLGVACTGTFEGAHEGALPPAHLACWSPLTGSWRDYGTFGDHNTYVRSTAVVGNTAYVGTGSAKKELWAVNLRTGKKRQLAVPEEVSGGTGFTYEMDADDRYLYVRWSPGGGYVYDTLLGRWTGSLGAYSGQSVSSRDRAGVVYLVSGNTLSRYVVGRDVLTPTSFAVGGSRGVERVTAPGSGRELVVGALSDGRVWQYDPATDEGHLDYVAGLVGTPVSPRAMAVGPDGRVYQGGYFSGGLSSYDSDTGAWWFHGFPKQAEGMVTHGSKLYLGTYTGAEIFEYDPAAPWGTDNPRMVLSMRDSGQDRPFAMASAGRYVAVGTEPGYGLLGGELALYDPADGSARRFPGIVPDQSITALTYADGVLYGGTMVYGGNGSTPTQTTAKVFAVDVASGTKLWETAPVPGERAISGLTVDAEGHLWGITAGTLFELDPATRETSRTHEVAPFDWDSVSEWNPLATKVSFDAGDGQLYVTARGRFHRLDPDTFADSAPSGTAAAQLVAHPDGDKYWIVGQHLYRSRWTPVSGLR